MLSHSDDTVGIPYVREAEDILLPIGMQGLFQHLTPPEGHLCCQAVAAKAHPTHAHSRAAVFHETGTNQAGSGLYEKLILSRSPSLPQMTRKHADTVPAHLRFTAVRIEDTHARYRARRRSLHGRLLPDQLTVATDAKMPITQGLRSGAIQHSGECAGVHNEVIITQPLPLVESHIRILFSARLFCQVQYFPSHLPRLPSGGVHDNSAFHSPHPRQLPPRVTSGRRSQSFHCLRARELTIQEALQLPETNGFCNRAGHL